MFSGPRRGKRSSEEIRPHAPSVNRDYNGNIWPVSNIKKSVSGRLESSQAVNCVVGKKKILPKNMCSGGRTGMCKSWISNWSWCPPTERDMHTHTHTQNPLTVPGYCLRPTRHQPNETYLWQEHAAPALLHTGTSWILAADTHTRTYSHSGRREADGKMKTGRKDAVVSFSPLPHWVLSHLVTRRLALCPMLRPRSPHSTSFSYPAANTSLVLRLSFFLNPRETVLHFCLSVFKLFLSQIPGSPSFFPQHAPQFHPPWLNPALSPRAPFTSDFDRPYFVAGTVKRTLWDWVEVAQTHTHWHLVVTQHCWSWDFHVLQEMSSLDSKYYSEFQL